VCSFSFSSFRIVLLLSLLVGATDCGSDCGANCPNLAFDVVATTGENLNVDNATWTGDACPTDAVPMCRGDFDGTNSCVRFTLIAPRPGSCRLDLTFTDGRLPFSATATFGPATTQGCCHGYPLTSGAASVTVPPLHPPAVVDAGPDGDASVGDATSSD
jgi:hypothetical protein